MYSLFHHTPRAKISPLAVSHQTAQAWFKGVSLLVQILAAFGSLLHCGCESVPVRSQAIYNPIPPSVSYAFAPTKVYCRRKIDALIASYCYAAQHKCAPMITSGSPSMEPVIHGQAYVVLKKAPFEAIKQWDLIVYRGRPDESKPDQLCMLHRAVARRASGWIMCGDNNTWAEAWEPLTPDRYIGTVVGIFAFPKDS